jgi:hypothetical protein
MQREGLLGRTASPAAPRIRVPTEHKGGTCESAVARAPTRGTWGGWVRTLWVVVAAIHLWGVVAEWWSRRWWRTRPEGADVRGMMRKVLGEGRKGQVAVDAVALAVAGHAGASAAQRLRETRRGSTVKAVGGTMGQVDTFLKVNEGLAMGATVLDADVWDVTLEAFLIAKVNAGGETAGWVRPRWAPCQPAVAGKEVGAVIAALERLGHVRQATWSRVAAQRVALGGREAGVARTPPIFTWEITERARDGGQEGVWQRCAWALVTVLAIGAGRIGNVSTIERRYIKLTSNVSVIIIDTDAVTKVDKERVVRRGVRRPVVLEHWLIARFVTPWVRELDAETGAPSTYIFPSLMETSYARRRTGVGRMWEGLWCEPVKPWSPAAVIKALDMALVERRGRTAKGFRGGNNRELRRRAEVEDVTRRVLHGRTVVDLIGSEDPYSDVFMEDFRAATRLLGCRRIVPESGMFSVNATSVSAGEHDDWVEVVGGLVVDGGDDEESSEEGEEVGPEERGYNCGRCARRVGTRDHGFRCDVQTCTWGLCVTCYPPRARRLELFCPEHTHE